MMTPEELTKLVKQKAIEEGADLVGISSISRYDGAPAPLRPQAHLPEAKAVIVMVVHHLDANVDFGAEPNSNYPAAFQLGMIPKLDTMAGRMGRFLDGMGFPSVPIMCTTYWHHRHKEGVPFDHHASFSHMNALVSAGLGEYGWHGMALSYKYGPRQRIVSVITSAPLIPDPLYNGEPLCDRCHLCEKACWGENYKPDALLEPKTISFTMEGKKIEYANINRWRCFWGEQCHLDMEHLAERSDMDEQKIYDAMDSGVVRVIRGNGGYMCSSFKYCMAKPLRTWDKSKAPNPRRIKQAPAGNWDSLKPELIKLAKKAGAESFAVIPLSKFQGLKPKFYEGFRTEDLYKNFKWVIAIGIHRPSYITQDSALAKKNAPIHIHMIGNLMMGILDMGRFLDDAGHEALTPWTSLTFGSESAKITGWEDQLVEALIVDAPLEEFSTLIDRPLDSLTKAADLIDLKHGKLPHVKLAGATPLSALPPDAAAELRTIMPKAKSLIVLGAELSKRVVELAGAQDAECAVSYMHANLQGMRETAWAAMDISAALRKQGFEAEPLVEVETWSKPRPQPHCHALPDLRAQAPYAAAAGLGFIGKNGFIIAPEYGPRLRFGFVLTTAEYEAPAKAAGSCPENCRICADACPVHALTDTGSKIFQRHEVRCEWARVMGMNKEEGSELGGWKLPDLPIPEELDDDARKAALAQKDPIQVKCYQRPNMSDTQVERCLQACPFAK